MKSETLMFLYLNHSLNFLFNLLQNDFEKDTTYFMSP